MTLTVLKLSDLTSDSFVALKTELGKVIFPFKIAFIATINMLSFIVYTDAVKLKNDQSVRNN